MNDSSNSMISFSSQDEQEDNGYYDYFNQSSSESSLEDVAAQLVDAIGDYLSAISELLDTVRDVIELDPSRRRLAANVLDTVEGIIDDLIATEDPSSDSSFIDSEYSEEE